MDVSYYSTLEECRKEVIDYQLTTSPGYVCIMAEACWFALLPGRNKSARGYAEKSPWISRLTNTVSYIHLLELQFVYLHTNSSLAGSGDSRIFLCISMLFIASMGSYAHENALTLGHYMEYTRGTLNM